jgi:hypothetical protein
MANYRDLDSWLNGGLDMKSDVEDPIQDVPVDDAWDGNSDIASIAVTPATPSFNTTQQMVATATYDDGHTAVITSIVTWASSDVTKATINAAGLATKVAAGTTTLSASYGGKTGSTVATVT